jgi:hypothetical protein
MPRILDVVALIRQMNTFATFATLGAVAHPNIMLTHLNICLGVLCNNLLNGLQTLGVSLFSLLPASPERRPERQHGDSMMVFLL